MQQNKNTKKISNISELLSNASDIPDTLISVMNKFSTKPMFSIFEKAKTKGIVLTDLLSILMILPFSMVSSVHSLCKSGINGIQSKSGKDAYYELKNNFKINWRSLLYLYAKRFKNLIKKNPNLETDKPTALIIDDTIIHKTGKKTEKVGYVHNHVGAGKYLLGFKLLVCGYFDGKSLTPLDFSIHREKGIRTKKSKLEVANNKTTKAIERTNKGIEKEKQNLKKIEIKIEKAETELNIKPTKIKQRTLDKLITKNELLLSKLSNYKTDLKQQKKDNSLTKKELNNFYKKNKMYGLTSDERKKQFKKDTPENSHGNKRRKEADATKIEIMLKMISRAVKNGFIPDYVLVDSWFFCNELLNKLKTIKKGSIKLISMVRLNNDIYTLRKNDKSMNLKKILKANLHKQIECRKYKAKYIKIECKRNEHNINLFFVKMGRSQNWHLLVTTDLTLGFIKLMEIYQIRWTIEVYFKESKQFLNLGKSQSQDFDAQIADATISMMQYILISYYKRINYQQTFTEIFEKLSNEVVKNSILNSLLNVFWQLMDLFCSVAGIDIIDVQVDIMESENFEHEILKLLPENILDNVA